MQRVRVRAGPLANTYVCSHRLPFDWGSRGRRGDARRCSRTCFAISLHREAVSTAQGLNEDPRQRRAIAFCLSLLSFKSERSVKKLVEGLLFYKLYHPAVFERLPKVTPRYALCIAFALYITDPPFAG